MSDTQDQNTTSGDDTSSDPAPAAVPNIYPGAVSGIDAEPLERAEPDNSGEAPFPSGDSLGGHDMIRSNPDGSAVEGDRTEGQFDPSEHTVDEVLAHLEGKDAAYQNRVLDQERAGQARKGIVGE